MNHRIAVWLLPVSTAVCALLPVDIALSQSFEPARLIALDDPEDLGCPNRDPLGTTFFCKVVVDSEGRPENVDGTHCFSRPGERERLGRDLRRKVLRSEFSPARVDGQGVRVFVPFRATLRPALRHCEVTIIPNFGFQREELGSQYLSPQEILEDGGWLERISSEELSWGIPSGLVFVMSVAVDEAGQASDGTVEDQVETEDISAIESVEIAVRSLENSRFIPAFVDGEPRAARYVDYLVLHPD